jgi:hypothetical protein
MIRRVQPQRRRQAAEPYDANQKVHKHWGTKYPKSQKARRTNQLPLSEGLTLPGRHCGSRRPNKKLNSFPYPQLGSVADGQQDINPGELGFTCEQFNANVGYTPSGLGTPHVGVSTTLANLPANHIESVRFMGIMVTGCMEEAKRNPNDGGSTHVAKQGLALRNSGVGSTTHTGKKAILAGQPLSVTTDLLKIEENENRVDDYPSPHLVSTEGVRKWSLRTEATCNLTMTNDASHYAYTALLATALDKNKNGNANPPDVKLINDFIDNTPGKITNDPLLGNFIFEVYNLCHQYSEDVKRCTKQISPPALPADRRRERRPRGGRADDQQQQQPIFDDGQNVEDGDDGYNNDDEGDEGEGEPLDNEAVDDDQPDQPVDLSSVQDQVTRPPLPLPTLRMFQRIMDAAVKYKKSLGTPIGVALSDSKPGNTLNVLLCGGGSL